MLSIVRCKDRPAISVGHVGPACPPHLVAAHPVHVQVPADGLCLYHCVVAGQDLQAWLKKGGNFTAEDSSNAEDARKARVSNWSAIWYALSFNTRGK